MGYGISAASGLPELWIAGWNDGGLDNGRDGFDQQLLQAAGPECDSVHGAAAFDERGADGAAELLASGAPGDGDDSAGEHRRPLRAAAARRDFSNEPMFEIAWAFSLPGQWTAIDPNSVDYDPNTGELTLPWNVLGLPYNEVTVTYTAGLAAIGDDVKTACAQIVRNAQSTPALNASKTKIDTMQMQYFSSSLLDETVQAWLRPYVANRLG